jgi:outer membrane protein assembly factor BamE (lipoprotein component of BamABCDE complex)
MTTGVDFDSSKVEKIERGKTTEKQILDMFGEPYTKRVVSANETIWVYMYVRSNAQMNPFLVTMSSETGQKMLEILFNEGIVVNYTYNVGKMPTTVNQ